MKHTEKFQFTLLSLFQQLQYTAPSYIDQLPRLTEEMLRVFLQQYPHLERMQVAQITMEEKVVKQIQQEYRYRMFITKFI